MKIFNKLNPYAFFLAFCFGIFMCYITSPTPQIVVKYPDPDNSIIRYIDNESNCFKYLKKEVKCPSSSKDIINL